MWNSGEKIIVILFLLQLELNSLKLLLVSSVLLSFFLQPRPVNGTDLGCVWQNPIWSDPISCWSESKSDLYGYPFRFCFSFFENHPATFTHKLWNTNMVIKWIQRQIIYSFLQDIPKHHLSSLFSKRGSYLLTEENIIQVITTFIFILSLIGSD